MPVTGNSIPNEIKQNNLPMIQTLPANKTSYPKFVSLRYLSANSVRNKLSSIPWLFETNLDVFPITETKLDSSFPECQFFLEGIKILCPSKHSS